MNVAITLQYYRNSISYAEDFDTLIVKGLDEPDYLRKLCIIQEYKDGRIKEQVKGFNKTITLRFRPSITAKQRRFLANWFIAEEKSLLYTNAESVSYVVTGITDRELVSEWLEACELDRIFELRFFDSRCYKVWVEGTSPDYGEDEMYMKLGIEMDDTKTELDPETFETNVGKLLVDEWGNPFPTFNPVTHTFFVVMKSSDGSSADYPIADIRIESGNLLFETFPASGFVPAQSGKLYANFAVWLQKKLTP